MSSEANETRKTDTAAPGAVAKEAPTEQQESRRGTPKRFAVGQTVCNEKNEKGKLCNGHLKEIRTAGEAAKHLRGDDVLHQCQTCGALYTGPPLGHVRDPRKQQRYVEKDLAAILRAAGGTLPAYDYPVPVWRGEAPRPPKATKTPAAASVPAAPAPEGETPEQKKARLVAEHKAKLAAKSAPAAEQAEVTADSSPAADSHRPAAEAQAATGAASAAPLSPAAATASPAAGAETPSDLAPEASTELTPGAPRDGRQEAPPSSSAAPAESAAPKPKPKRAVASHPGSLPPIAPHLAPPPGETPEQKRERLRLVVEEAKRKAGKL